MKRSRPYPHTATTAGLPQRRSRGCATGTPTPAQEPRTTAPTTTNGGCRVHANGGASRCAPTYHNPPHLAWGFYPSRHRRRCPTAPRHELRAAATSPHASLRRRRRRQQLQEAWLLCSEVTETQAHSALPHAPALIHASPTSRGHRQHELTLAWKRRVLHATLQTNGQPRPLTDGPPDERYAGQTEPSCT